MPTKQDKRMDKVLESALATNAILRTVFLISPNHALKHLGFKTDGENFVSDAMEKADYSLLRELLVELRNGRSSLGWPQVIQKPTLPIDPRRIGYQRKYARNIDMSINTSIESLNQNLQLFSRKHFNSNKLADLLTLSWWRLRFRGEDLELKESNGSGIRILARMNCELSYELPYDGEQVRGIVSSLPLSVEVLPGLGIDEGCDELYLSVKSGQISLMDFGCPPRLARDLSSALHDVIPFVTVFTIPTSIRNPDVSSFTQNFSKLIPCGLSIAPTGISMDFQLNLDMPASPSAKPESEAEKKAAPIKQNLNGVWQGTHSDGPGQPIDVKHVNNSVFGHYINLRICEPGGARPAEAGETGLTSSESFNGTLAGLKIVGETNVCFTNDKNQCSWIKEPTTITVSADGNTMSGTWLERESNTIQSFVYVRKNIDVFDCSLVEFTNYGNNSQVKTGYAESPLEFISMGEHRFFEGNTLLYGTIALRGERGAILEEITLELLLGGEVEFIARLTEEAQSELITMPFPPDGFIRFEQDGHKPRALFKLGAWDQDEPVLQEISYKLRVRAKSEGGGESTLDLPRSVKLLIPFKTDAKVFDPDPQYGGDYWVRPSVKPVIEYFMNLKKGYINLPAKTEIVLNGFLVNDISNMNGGPFEPHVGHRNGCEFDGFFYELKNIDGSDYDEKIALKLIAYLNDECFGSRIEKIFVEPHPEKGDKFWQTIKSAHLLDGRTASDVVQWYAGHRNHFHWNIKPEG
jgi:hypothetical protein